MESKTRPLIIGLISAITISLSSTTTAAPLKTGIEEVQQAKENEIQKRHAGKIRCP
jgi:hypothetical protein